MKYFYLYQKYKLIFLIIIYCIMQYLIPNKYSKILQNINMKLYISNELIKIYSILYDAARKGYNNPKYNKIVDKKIII